MIRTILVVICIFFLVTGCVTTNGNRQDADEKPILSGSIHEIDQWIDSIVPQLARKITKNPNLKGKAFTLAAWDVQKNTLKTDISALERDLLEQLNQKLLTHPGVNCIPRSPVRPLDLEHQDRLIDISCSAYRDIEWYLLLTARIRPTTGELSIRIHGVMPEQSRFIPISGLSETFSCAPSEKLLALSKDTRVDEYLRGLRYLPFEESQKDLMAAYLARRVSCIFQSMAEGNLFTVYINQSDMNNSRFFRDMLKIVELYLDQFQELQIVSKPAGANAVMVCKTYPITSDLCQVWITVETKKEGKKIGASTATYLKKKVR